jgi:large subunit ribosomal protein L30
MPRTFVWHPGKGPAQTGKNTLTSGQVEIRQVRSKIGHSWRMRATLEAIGLKHHQDVVIKQDSPSLRGQIKHVRHLIQVTPIEGQSNG